MTNKELLGRLGEELVANILGATLSEDKYDMKKDMILADGTCVEVKTQIRHPTNNCMTINSAHSNNISKCLTVDRLVFVEFDDSDTIYVRECIERENYITYRTRPAPGYPHGRDMIGWPISKMRPIKEVYDPTLASKMRSLSSSTQFSNAKHY